MTAGAHDTLDGSVESADAVDGADTDGPDVLNVLGGSEGIEGIEVIVDLGSGSAAAVIGDLGCVVDEVAF